MDESVVEEEVRTDKRHHGRLLDGVELDEHTGWEMMGDERRRDGAAAAVMMVVLLLMMMVVVVLAGSVVSCMTLSWQAGHAAEPPLMKTLSRMMSKEGSMMGGDFHSPLTSQVSRSPHPTRTVMFAHKRVSARPLSAHIAKPMPSER